MESKAWYTSKMLWVNAVATLAVLAQLITGREIFDVEAQAVILGLVNIILRLVTKQPLSK